MCVSLWKKVVAACLGVLSCVGLLCGCQPETPKDPDVVELTFEESETVGLDYSRFTDVAGHPAESYIKALSLLGIARGRTDTKFAPDENITRAEFTEMVAYASGLTASAYKGIYTDVDGAKAYAGILQAAHTAGLIDTKFVIGDTFNGNSLITREEIASMLSAGYKQLTGKDANPEVISQLATSAPQGNMTRADAAKLVFALQDSASKMFQWGFDSDLSGWRALLRTAGTSNGKTNAEGKASWSSKDGYTAPGCMLFDLKYTGMNQVNCFWWEYNAVGKNSGNLLEKGKTYLLTFFAKVEGNADAVNLNVVKFRSYTDNAEEYTNLCNTSLSGDGWQLYCMEFTATATVKQAQLIFQAGGCDNFNTKIYIDDISLQEFDKHLGVRASAEDAYANVSAISGSGKYSHGQSANLIAAGKKVDGEYYLAHTWTDSEYGNVVGLGSVYTNAVTKHRTMEVSYQKFAVLEKDWGFAATGNTADILLSNVTRKSGKVSVSAKLSVPQGYTLAEVGVLYYNGSYAENLSVFTNGAVIAQPASIAADGTFQVAHSGFAATSDVLVKGYAICKDANDNYIVFYSNDQVATAEESQAQIDYKLIYNLEMLYCFYRPENSNEEAWSRIVKQIATTDSDMITLTPQMCRTHLWSSEKYADWKDLPPAETTEYQIYQRGKAYCQDNDAFQVMLDLFRENGFDTVFVDYRMNEKQNTDNENHPFNNPFYLDHKEWWLNPNSLAKDRVFNYMEPGVREYYFGVLKELVTNYDVDGLSLDFERAPIFFKSEEIAEGTQVMTDFVGRIRAMLDEVGKAKGKYLPLGVRVCSSLEKSLSVGLDVEEWVKRGYIDYVNATSSYYHTPSVDVESYINVVDDDVKVYAELHYAVHEQSTAPLNRVLTTVECMKATAENFYARGVDGLSAFNMDYSNDVPETLLGLTGITDREALKNGEKHYVLLNGYDYTSVKGGTTVTPYLAVDSSKFDYALLRIRANNSIKKASFDVIFNGKKLSLADTVKLTDKTELFPRVTSASTDYPTASYVKYYIVPLALIENGENSIEIKQASGTSCTIDLIDIGIYHEDSHALKGNERKP